MQSATSMPSSGGSYGSISHLCMVMSSACMAAERASVAACFQVASTTSPLAQNLATPWPIGQPYSAPAHMPDMTFGAHFMRDTAAGAALTKLPTQNAARSYVAHMRWCFRLVSHSRASAAVTAAEPFR